VLSSALAAIGLSLETAFFMFWETLWPLVLGFGLSGAVQAFASRSAMLRALGDQRPATLARASFFGMISSSCSYAASAMAKSLFQKGADFTAAMTFMLASTNLVLELGLVLWVLIGWQFTLAEYVGGAVMIGLLAVVARLLFRPAVVTAARDRVVAAAREHDHEHAAGDEEPARKRMRTLAGWADAASYTMADLNMLRREMLVGYLVAGFLTVLVPVEVWNAVFFRGHGIWTTIENVLVGPLIALLSFVCSIGNVPLAAALWHGGISFGGTVSFIFADLITLPLILIYRKLYGWALTWRLVAAFWIVMSAAGLVVEVVFGAAGLVPTARPAVAVHVGFEWNYTTVLNLVSIVVFAGMLWLSRNRQRIGGGDRYAIDPVCGMQVDKRLAPAHIVTGALDVYFCSDHCRDRFESRRPEVPIVATAVDPVCGMTVDKAAAAAARVHAGETYYFCNPGCAAEFEAHPEEYLQPKAGSGG
jgi:uncharacterized membrane protein YraQ (UPF0718 family)/YHS domain-containing protein